MIEWRKERPINETKESYKIIWYFLFLLFSVLVMPFGRCLLSVPPSLHTSLHSLSFLPAVTHKEKERSDRQEPMNPPALIPFQPFPLRSFLTPFQLLPSLWCEREWSDTERPVNGMDEGSWECRVSRGTSPSHVGCLEVTKGTVRQVATGLGLNNPQNPVDHGEAA